MRMLLSRKSHPRKRVFHFGTKVWLKSCPPRLSFLVVERKVGIWLLLGLVRLMLKGLDSHEGQTYNRRVTAELPSLE